MEHPTTTVPLKIRMSEGHDESHGHALYAISLTLPHGQSMTTARRYSEFASLRDQLAPFLTDTEKGMFPSKHPLSSSKDPAVVEERLKALPRWLVSISRHPNISSQPVFRQFLGLDKIEPVLASEAASLSFTHAVSDAGVSEPVSQAGAPLGQPQQPVSGGGGSTYTSDSSGLGAPGGMLAPNQTTTAASSSATITDTEAPQPGVRLAAPFGAPGAESETESVTLHAPHVMGPGEFTATGSASAPPPAGDEVATAEVAVEMRMPPNTEGAARAAIDAAQRSIEQTRLTEDAAARLDTEAAAIASAAQRTAGEAEAAQRDAALLAEEEMALTRQAEASAREADALAAAAAELRRDATAKAQMASATEAKVNAATHEAGECAYCRASCNNDR